MCLYSWNPDQFCSGDTAQSINIVTTELRDTLAL